MTIASDLRKRVAAEVRAAMARQNYSKSDLAKVIDKSWGTAKSRYLGNSPFDFDELAKVCAWLEVPLTQFLPPELAAQQVRDAS